MTVRCLVIGAGKMGSAHLQALVALEPDALAGWAPSERRREAAESVGAGFFHGPLDAALDAFQPTHVVVASPVETLTPISLQLIAAGVRHLLVEKPVALSGAEGAALAAAVKASGAQLNVGYNRRFYSSIRTAQRLIAEAGEEIESVAFEFNEVVPDPAGPLAHAPSVRERWLLANSLHVIDSALFPVGHPDPLRSSFTLSGALAWHPSGSVFVGSGLTVLSKPFVYHANWSAPGRWSFEWMTPSARYVFRPLEKLAVMRRGSFNLEDVPLDDELDRRFKPGVYLQDRAFLFGGEEAADLVSLENALSLVRLGEAMAGYAVPEPGLPGRQGK
jgi:predicted dehydrogenase